ncbi:MAG: hypothetical protein HYY24_02860 [Verrucomicrobia bacterium]|nr:hypothetical protein [Verrucomicrobiota bacterium]
MKEWLHELDRLLRGEATRPSALREGKIEVHAGGLLVLLVALGLIYGMCLGCFALFNAKQATFQQFVAAALKVPCLFLLTLVVTLPSLYVFNALVGSRLTLLSVWRLLIAALAVTLAVLASFGPIVAFFAWSTTSYSFMVLLNVVMFGASGVLGLVFLLQTLHRLSIAASEAKPPESKVPPVLPGESAPGTGALDKLEGQVLGRHVKLVFRCWVVVFGLVGAQMSWVLRPFLGNPDQAFTWFRPRGSSFFEGVWGHIVHLFQ